MLGAKYDVMDVAEYVLDYCENELKKPITNLQLQKTLYYVQGMYVAKYDKPLFDNNIEAWPYGPVVPEAYYSYSNFLSKPIVGVKPLTENLFTEEEKNFINGIVNKMIEIKPWELVDKTHEELPWKKSNIPGRKMPIKFDLIEGWFKEHQEEVGAWFNKKIDENKKTEEKINAICT